MAKIKLPKKASKHGNIYNKGKKIARKLTPREIIELEVVHTSVKTHVSR